VAETFILQASGFFARAAFVAGYFLRKRSSRTTSAPSPGLLGASSPSAAGSGAGTGSAGAGGNGQKGCRGSGSASNGWEFQAKLYGRIEEALDRGERHHQPLGDAAERQADFKTVLRHHEVPELMLEDDGHLFRILREQPRRQV